MSSAEARIDATFQHVVDDKVEGVEVGEFVAHDATGVAVAEEFGDPRLGHLFQQQGPSLRAIRDDADIEPIALVAGATVGKAVQRHRARSAGHGTVSRKR